MGKITQEQLSAIQNRDKAYDGRFYYGIKTTGTVCRPSCHKKSCIPENIVTFDTLEEALEQGYRPCKRCRPDIPEWKGARAELAELAARYIEENYLKEFSLERMAQELHVNKYYLLRTFKQITGETLLACQNRIRCEKAKEMLKDPELEISYISDQCGYNFVSHFSRVFKKTVGVTPSQFRREQSG